MTGRMQAYLVGAALALWYVGWFVLSRVSATLYPSNELMVFGPFALAAAVYLITTIFEKKH
jgi:hypothetical protein